jgi:hypothetical protein
MSCYKLIGQDVGTADFRIQFILYSVINFPGSVLRISMERSEREDAIVKGVMGWNYCGIGLAIVSGRRSFLLAVAMRLCWPDSGHSRPTADRQSENVVFDNKVWQSAGVGI